MWPWIKRWHDWAITDLWPLTQAGVQAQTMHYSYEKGGLVIDNQPIPWNADAVVVECLARLPASAVRRKDEFQLRIPGADSIPLDVLRREETQGRFRLFFRLAPPSKTTNAEVMWRHHRLSEITLPVVQRDEFLSKLRLQHATLAVRLGDGDQAIACQTIVSSQCRGLLASAVLTSPTSLAPLSDLDLRVEWRLESDDKGKCIPICLSSSQLKGKQALLTVCPVKRPNRAGAYIVVWKLGDQALATQRIKAISKNQFLRSLRLSESRLVVQNKAGDVRLARQLPPLDGIARVGPCFLVSSSEIGMAGTCCMSVRAQLADGLQSPVLLEQDVLVTDGPTPLVPGTIEAHEVSAMKAFEVLAEKRSLGVMSLTPAPLAEFDSEGGFKALPDYSWSTAAEDQLQEKLTRLLEPRGNGK